LSKGHIFLGRQANRKETPGIDHIWQVYVKIAPPYSATYEEEFMEKLSSKLLQTLPNFSGQMLLIISSFLTPLYEGEVVVRIDSQQRLYRTKIFEEEMAHIWYKMQGLSLFTLPTLEPDALVPLLRIDGRYSFSHPISQAKQVSYAPPLGLVGVTYEEEIQDNQINDLHQYIFWFQDWIEDLCLQNYVSPQPKPPQDDARLETHKRVKTETFIRRRVGSAIEENIKPELSSPPPPVWIQYPIVNHPKVPVSTSIRKIRSKTRQDLLTQHSPAASCLIS